MKIKKNLAKKFKPLKKPILKKSEETKQEKLEKIIEKRAEDIEETIPIFESHFESGSSLDPEDLILSSGQTLQQGDLETTAQTATSNTDEKPEDNLIKYESFEGLYSERKEDHRNQDPNRTFELHSRDLETFETRMPTTNTIDPRTRMGMVRPSELMDIDQDEKYEIQDIREKKDEKMPWEQEQDPNIKKYNSRR